MNCFVTGNRELLQDITEFDAIVFHAPEFVQKGVRELPQRRKSHQKYIFTSIESPAYYPICNEKFLNFFNWTWTYKLNSDLNYAYMSVWDKNGNVIGPKDEMHWMKVEDMLPINDTLKQILNGKTTAAAWFVSNCRARSRRDSIAKKLQIELQTYGMRLDIYGSCGTMKCSRSSMNKCLSKLRNDYYFYLSFENSFSEDYVTEKLLHALENYAVPVVYGGANYTRFMPDGIYLSANTLTIKELAKKMVDIIQNKELYYEYFKWHNHYSYRDIGASVTTDPYCKLCEAINNEEEMSKRTIYKDIGGWWSPKECQVKTNLTPLNEQSLYIFINDLGNGSNENLVI
ncbi:alpha-(1,3)-fucosyltransferase C-like [Spodoptera litura]|uniref:Fucosyltransferase n=1 Tax=Spodoptera litura TaxID=69820 RepID=A0A9J7ITW0_SPOLT|nr:alpha-(1,3)-fucosyltransferase C-like [Spodoptera litura]